MFLHFLQRSSECIITFTKIDTTEAKTNPTIVYKTEGAKSITKIRRMKLATKTSERNTFLRSFLKTYSASPEQSKQQAIFVFLNLKVYINSNSHNTPHNGQVYGRSFWAKRNAPVKLSQRPTGASWCVCYVARIYYGFDQTFHASLR